MRRPTLLYSFFQRSSTGLFLVDSTGRDSDFNKRQNFMRLARRKKPWWLSLVWLSKSKNDLLKIHDVNFRVPRALPPALTSPSSFKFLLSPIYSCRVALTIVSSSLLKFTSFVVAAAVIGLALSLRTVNAISLEAVMETLILPRENSLYAVKKSQAPVHTK